MDHDYHSTVYAWFEKCGIISNVRTHLRQNLIDALRNKDLVSKRDTGPKSAKQYVYDLLIAEYLFNHNYAYTLSVFASEASLLVNFRSKTGQKLGNNVKDDREKLQNDYILHALETLGINPNGYKGQYVMSQYLENDMPLLLCILKCISSFSFDARDEPLAREEKSFQNACTQTEFSQSSDTGKAAALKRKILQQKQAIDNKLLERQTNLKQQAIVVEEQLEFLNTKLQQVQNIMRNIDIKEKELKEQKQNDEQQSMQKNMELMFKEKLLQQESDRLQREENHYKKFQQDLKHLQEELFKVQKELPGGEARTATTVKNVEVQTDPLDVQTKDEELKVLTRERERLTGQVEEQKLRNEQITQRAFQLSRQVEEIQLLRATSTEVPTQTANTHTIVSESSSTEDILQDAKLRLKRLEEESLKADQYYYNFISASP